MDSLVGHESREWKFKSNDLPCEWIFHEIVLFHMSEIQRQHAYNTPQFYNIVKNKMTLVSYEDKSILKSISKTMVKLDF